MRIEGKGYEEKKNAGKERGTAMKREVSRELESLRE